MALIILYSTLLFKETHSNKILYNYSFLIKSIHGFRDMMRVYRPRRLLLFYYNKSKTHLFKSIRVKYLGHNV